MRGFLLSRQRASERLALRSVPRLAPDADAAQCINTMDRVNTFFWSRLNPTGELVRSVDVLLRELVPDDKLDAAFQSLSIAASPGTALAEPKP
ncbi:hypothetical protein PR002_g27053, partial [Phytophthora rubi]